MSTKDVKEFLITLCYISRSEPSIMRESSESLHPATDGNTDPQPNLRAGGSLQSRWIIGARGVKGN